MSAPLLIMEIILPVAKGLVLAPESVRVSVCEKDRLIVLTLAVAPSDRGRIIGRQGKTLQALRLIAQSIATLHSRNCLVELDEGE